MSPSGRGHLVVVEGLCVTVIKKAMSVGIIPGRSNHTEKASYECPD